MIDTEKAGLFYLGRAVEPPRDFTLLASRHLTADGVLVGMPGSGKTSLGIALLEEALLDNIPVIAVAPKGDLGNLLLTFDEPTAERMEPFVDPAAADSQGLSRAEFAAQQAARWRKGWAEWGVDGARVKRLRQGVELALYTSGSAAGRAVSALRSFDPPLAAARGEADLFAKRLGVAASSILALARLEADALSAEHIHISNILAHAWRRGRAIGLAALIGQVQTPPFDRVGVLTEPEPGQSFPELPRAVTREQSHKAWLTALTHSVRFDRPLLLWRCDAIKAVSERGEEEAGFRARLGLLARERCDEAVEKLHKCFERRIGTAQRRVQRAPHCLQREQGQVAARELDAAVSVRRTVFGAVFGSRRIVAQAGRAMKSATRASREREDVDRAREKQSAAEAALCELEQELATSNNALDAALDPGATVLDEVAMRAKSADIVVRVFGLMWRRYRRTETGFSPGWLPC